MTTPTQPTPPEQEVTPTSVIMPTEEQIRIYQRAFQVQQEKELHQCLADLKSLASERGFEIVAIPQFTNDGRVIADWGVVRRER